MEKPVIIFGAGGMGKAALEIFNTNKVIVYCFLDDDSKLHGTEINGISIMGSTDDPSLLKSIGEDCEAFVASDETSVRRSIVEMLNEQRKVMPVNAIHENAIIPDSASVEHGNFINSGVILGTGTHVGNHCIIHSNATIDYGALLADFVQVGTGSIIGPDGNIGKSVFIGSGVTIVGGVTIGENSRIGTGSVVIADIQKNSTVFGNPAKPV
jgi:sugar O-acyltransferase (sialic acid O-acetyltransferase NeuD family)